MKKHQAWIIARDPQSLAIVASVLIFEHNDRLRCEDIAEHAATDFGIVAQVIRLVQPHAIISTEVKTVLTDSRTRFEAWIVETWGTTAELGRSPWDNEDYDDLGTQMAWDAWEAAHGR